MRKINVIGTTGSGKSLFSRKLAEKIDSPYIQMDQIFWGKDWKEPTDEEFIPKLKDAISGDKWVLDGNYSRTNAIKWKHADVIIWIDYSYCRTLLQLLLRTLKRTISGNELWPDTGNKESFSKSFMSKKSILLWFFKNYKKNKSRYSELMSSTRMRNVTFVRLRSPKEVDKFIDSIGKG